MDPEANIPTRLQAEATGDGASPKPNFLSEIFPGLGIGLLVGILVGMSVSPVVGGVLSALGGLLGAMLGLSGDGGAPGDHVLSRFQVNGLRIGSFGFACVVGVLFGVYIRAHDLFSVPVKAQIASWEQAGFSKEEARQFVVFQMLRLKPEGKTVVSGDAPKGNSVLFGVVKDLDLCEKVSMGRYDNDPAEVLKAYRGLGKGNTQDRLTPLFKEFSTLADRIEHLSSNQQIQILQSVEGIICQIQKLDEK